MLSDKRYRHLTNLSQSFQSRLLIVCFLIFLGLSLIAGLLFLVIPEVKPASYVVVDLGRLEGYRSQIIGMNNQGEFVGQASSPSRSGFAFYWSKEKGLIDLFPESNGITAAVGINDQGLIIGYSNHGDEGRKGWRGSLSGGFGDLGSLGGKECVPCGLNRCGQIVGYSSVEGEKERKAFLWDDGKLVALEGLGGPDSAASNINTRGDIVGWSQVSPGGETHACLWHKEKGLVDLGTLGGTVSQAIGIDDQQRIIGWSEVTGGGFTAFVWAAGQPMCDLGSLGGKLSRALALGPNGLVLGWTEVVSQDQKYLRPMGTEADPKLSSLLLGRAFFWKKEKMFNLDEIVGDPEYRILEARGMDSSGRILAYAEIQGDFRTVLLEPSSKETRIDLIHITPPMEE